MRTRRLTWLCIGLALPAAANCPPTRRSIQFGMTPARQRGTAFGGDFRRR